MVEPGDLFEYTSGRWIYNDALRHRERRRAFNVSELKRLAARSIHRNEDDVVGFEKLAEGGFNRSFIVSMRGGFKFIARIPYPLTEPKSMLVASEVATMDFLRFHGIPVPTVFGYSLVADNPAGTEYIFMELMQGTNLGDVWYTLSEQDRAIIITNIVQLESRLFALDFPASGSLYYCDDLSDQDPRVQFSSPDSIRHFCIGPDTSLKLWYGKRSKFSIERGPYRDPLAALSAGAIKEITYLRKFGQAVQPFQRLRREIYDYQTQSPVEHIATLEKYLQIARHLIPNDRPTLHRPTIRHPDLQPNNIFISDSLDITGLIDWQHAAVLPLFLQCSIPGSLQNYGDHVSEALEMPTLPSNFGELEGMKQASQAELFRRRHIHYLYVKLTETMNRTHYDALTYDFSTLRRRLFHHASDPWEGDNTTMKADLVNLFRNWTAMTGPETYCPISFSGTEAAECLRLDQAQTEADEQLQAGLDVVGVGSEGWVPVAYYEEAKQRAEKLKRDALDAADTDEDRARIHENWVFDDFSEEEYS